MTPLVERAPFQACWSRLWHSRLASVSIATVNIRCKLSQCKSGKQSINLQSYLSVRHSGVNLKNLTYCASSSYAFSVQVIKYPYNDNNSNNMSFYGPFTPGWAALSHRRDLLEQPLDYYKPDVLPATQPVVSKHYKKKQWFGCLLFYRHGISTPWQGMTNQQCQSTEGIKNVYIVISKQIM